MIGQEAASVQRIGKGRNPTIDALKVVYPIRKMTALDVGITAFFVNFIYQRDLGVTIVVQQLISETLVLDLG